MEFIDLKTQQLRIKSELDRRLAKVLQDGQYIMGPEVGELEQKLCELTGAGYCVTCANGTDALVLALKTFELEANDVVFVPAFTYSATAEAVVLAGGQPYFVDVDEGSFNLSAESLGEGIADARNRGYNIRGVIVVGLFGSPADFDKINPICDQHGLFVIDDAAQSLGSSYNGRKTGTLADITATSFFPSKPLGCYGDGGAIFTDSKAVAKLLGSLRVHGKGKDKYDNIRVGTNSRLDTLQAAVLLAKLDVFDSELQSRAQIADQYRQLLCQSLVTQKVEYSHTSAWAQYSVVSEDRAGLLEKLKEAEIPYAMYYPLTMSQQVAYSRYPACSLVNAENLAQKIFQLPFHPYLSDADMEHICGTLEARA